MWVIIELVPNHPLTIVHDVVSKNIIKCSSGMSLKLDVYFT